LEVGCLGTQQLTCFFAFPKPSIVMARHALFPETMLNSVEMTRGADGEDTDAAPGNADVVDALLAKLSGWMDSSETKPSDSSFSFESFSYEEVLTDELQAWRKNHVETPYEEWTDEKKQEFNVSRKVHAIAYVSIFPPEANVMLLPLPVVAANVRVLFSSRIFTRSSQFGGNKKKYFAVSSTNKRECK
jgi:hypothetical protein